MCPLECLYIYLCQPALPAISTLLPIEPYLLALRNARRHRVNPHNTTQVLPVFKISRVGPVRRVELLDHGVPEIVAGSGAGAAARDPFPEEHEGIEVGKEGDSRVGSEVPVVRVEVVHDIWI